VLKYIMFDLGAREHYKPDMHELQVCTTLINFNYLIVLIYFCQIMLDLRSK